MMTADPTMCPAFASPVGATSALRSVYSPYPPKQKMRGELTRSNIWKNCDSKLQQQDSLYSTTLSSLATQALPVLPEAPRRGQKSNCTATVQDLPQQVLQVIPEQTLKQLAESAISSAVISASNTAAARRIPANQRGALNIQDLYSRINRVLALSAACEATATIQKEISTASSLFSKHQEDTEGVERRMGKPKQGQMLPLVQQLLGSPKRANATRNYPLPSHTIAACENVQRFQEDVPADEEQTVDPYCSSGASDVGQPNPNREEAGLITTERKTEMVSVTATQLPAKDPLSEPQNSSFGNHFAPGFNQQRKQWCCDTRAASQESNNDTNRSAGKTSDSGSTTKGSNNVKFVSDRGVRRKPTFVAPRRPTDCERRMFGCTDVTAIKDTLLLQYVRLLKALLQDVSCSGYKSALKTRAANQQFLEHTVSCPWSKREIDAATLNLNYQKDITSQKAQESPLEANGPTPAEKQDCGGYAPQQRRLLQTLYGACSAQPKEVGQLQMGHAGKTQTLETADSAASANNMRWPQCTAGVTATREKNRDAVRERDPSLAQTSRWEMPIGAAVSTCVELSRTDQGVCNRDRLQFAEAWAPAIHDQRLLQTLLSTHEYLRQLHGPASRVLREKTTQKEKTCSVSGRRQNRRDCDAVYTNPLQREEPCAPTESTKTSSPPVRAEHAGNSFIPSARQTAHLCAAMQERRSLPRSKPLNPYAAPFVPRFPLASPTAADTHYTRNCRNSSTPAGHRLCAVYSSASSASSAACSGCPEVWKAHTVPFVNQPPQQSQSWCGPPQSSTVVTSATTAAQTEKASECGALRPMQSSSVYCHNQRPPPAMTVKEAPFRQYLQQFLLQYMQYQAPEHASDELHRVCGRSALRPVRTTTRYCDAEAPSKRTVSPPSGIAQSTTREEGGETPRRLQQVLADGLSAKTEARTAICRAQLCLQKAEEVRQQQSVQEQLLGEMQRGHHVEKASGKTTHTVDHPLLLTSKRTQKSAESAAALQQLLLYFRRKQQPQYLVARGALQQLTGTGRHPYSSPLPPALLALSKLRPIQPLPHTSTGAAGTPRTSSRRDGCLELEEKARAALMTARRLLQTTARKETVHRATDTLHRRAASMLASDIVKANRNALTPSMATRATSHLAQIGPLENGDVEEIVGPAVRQHLQQSHDQPQFQECLLQPRQFQPSEPSLQDRGGLRDRRTLQNALANLLQGGLGAGKMETERYQFSTREAEALEKAFSPSRLGALLRHLRRIYGLDENHYAWRNSEQETMKQSVYPSLQESTRRNMHTTTVALTPSFCPQNTLTHDKEKMTNSAEGSFQENSSKRKSTRVYTKLELLQTYRHMRKAQHLSYAEGSTGLSQRKPCENNLLFQVMLVSRSPVGSGQHHRIHRHQQSNCQQHQHDETEKHQYATVTASVPVNSRTAGKLGAHTVTVTSLHNKPLPPETIAFQRSLSPFATADGPSPPKLLRYFLSPKSASEHSPRGTRDSSVIGGSVASEIHAKIPDTRKSAKMISSSVISRAAPAEAPSAPSQDTWAQLAHSEPCPSRFPAPQSSECDSPRASAGIPQESNTIEQDCLPSSALTTRDCSTRQSASSRQLVLHKPAETNSKIEQPTGQKEGASRSGSHQRTVFEDKATELSCQRKQPSENFLSQQSDAEAPKWQPFAGRKAVPLIVSDQISVTYVKEVQRQPSSAPLRRQHGQEHLTQPDLNSTAFLMLNATHGSDSLGIFQENHGRQEPATLRVSSSTPTLGSAAVGLEHQNIDLDTTLPHPHLEEQQHMDLSHQKTFHTTNYHVQTRPFNSAPVQGVTFGVAELPECLSQRPRKIVSKDSSTSGGTPVNTKKTRDSAASGLRLGAVDVHAQEDIGGTKMAKAPRSARVVLSLEARSDYVVVGRKKSEWGVNQTRNRVSPRVSPMPPSTMCTRLWQRLTSSGPDEVCDPLVDRKSVKVNHFHKTRRQALAATVSYLSALTQKKVERREGCVDAPEKKPKGASEGADNIGDPSHRMEKEAHKTIPAPQSTRLHQSFRSQHTIPRTISTFPGPHCGDTAVEKVALATTETDTPGGVNEQDGPVAATTGNVSTKPEGRPYTFEEGEFPCDKAVERHCGETRMTETSDSSCSTTTAEVAPYIAAQDRRHSSVSNLVAPAETILTVKRSTRLTRRNECLGSQGEQYSTSSAENLPIETGKLSQLNSQPLSQLSKARDASAAASLRMERRSLDVAQQQRRQKQGQLLHQARVASSPRKQQRHEADEFKKNKGDVYVKKKEQGTRERSCSQALAQQHKRDPNFVPVGHDRESTRWAATAGAREASSPAAPAREKQILTECDATASSRPCNALPSIHCETQSGERW